MANSYEVHCVEIERAASSASVMGTVSQGPMSGVKGRSSTVHSAHILASGKSYRLRQFNETYPFAVGERMVFLCELDHSSGAYRVISLVNLSTGTYHLSTNESQRLRAKLFLIISLLMCLSVVGWFTTPFVAGWYAYKHKKVWPILDNANGALDKALKSSKKDRISIERALTGFDGPTYIGSEFS